MHDPHRQQRNPLLPAPPPAAPAPEPPVESSALLGDAVAVTRGPQQPVGVAPQAHMPPGLGFAAVHGDPPVWVVGLHGGCGASTVAALLQGAAELRGRWPHPASPGMAVPRALLVARTHAYGLDRAAAAASQWASNTTGVLLVGLVLVSDGPNIPKPLSQRSQQLAGMLPALWHVDWLESLRLTATPPQASELPRRVRKTATSISKRIEETTQAGRLQLLSRKDTH